MQLFRDLREGRAVRFKQKNGLFPIFIDYNPKPEPRYGYGRPPHPKLFEILNRNRSQYSQILQSFLKFSDDLAKIPVHQPEDPRMPYWLNQFLMGLDPISLYCFGCVNNPRNYIEIGSGNSTKFMKRAIEDHGLQTRLISIDPHPRAEIDALCDEVRREVLEDTDLAVFERLVAGDIVFVDGSHRVFMNSDVCVIFLEVLPKLPPGVLIYIDDIYLPYDYPMEWWPRYYSEQYLLAVLLLAETDRYDVLLPCTFIERDSSLQEILKPLWRGTIADGVARGNGFWLKTR